MEIIKFKKNYGENIVVCMGYFDAVHVGHLALIEKAKQIAQNIKAKTAVFMLTGGKNGKDLFSFEERVERLKRFGVQTIIYAELDNEFMSIPATDFLNLFFSLYNVKAVVCGEDFTFGCGAKGNVSLLSEYLSKKDVEHAVVSPVKLNGEKVSTKAIKTAVLSGNLDYLNLALNCNYSISGKVVKGKRLGTSLGFPTANIVREEQNLLIKNGVYYTCVALNGKKYKAITNVGAQPTVNGQNTVVETYISGFNGDLYGKTISINFIKKIRDIIAFKNVNELKAQLEKDLRSIND